MLSFKQTSTFNLPPPYWSSIDYTKRILSTDSPIKNQEIGKRCLSLLILASTGQILQHFNNYLGTLFSTCCSLTNNSTLFCKNWGPIYSSILLAPCEAIHFLNANQYFGPATEIVTIIEHEMTEDVCWLKSIKIEDQLLESEAKIRSCPTKSAIDLQQFASPVQELLVLLSSCQESRRGLVIGCFLVKPNLQDYSNINSYATQWIESPYQLAPSFASFAVKLKVPYTNQDNVVVEAVQKIISAEGFPLDPIFKLANSTVLFNAPAALQWLCEFKMAHLQERFREHGLQVESIRLR